MAWITFNETHVLARLSEDERDAYESAGDQSPESKRMPGIIAQVIAHVRGKVAGCVDNRGRMGPAGTIPEECVYSAATLARDALIGSQPTSEGETDLRKEELRGANRYLDQVASCDVAIADQHGNYPGEPLSSSASFGGDPVMSF